MTWQDFLGSALTYAGLNGFALIYLVHKIKPVTPIDPQALARIAEPLDNVLRTEILFPGTLSRSELRFCISEARKALIAAGGPSWEPPKPKATPPPPDEHESELDIARRAIEADRWFAPLACASDTISDHVEPNAPHTLVMGVVCVVNAVILLLHQTRYQGADVEQATAELLVRVAGLLNAGATREPVTPEDPPRHRGSSDGEPRARRFRE